MRSPWLLCDRDRQEAILCNCSIYGKKDLLDSIIRAKKFALFGKSDRVVTDSLKNQTAKHSFTSFCCTSCVDSPRSYLDEIVIEDC
ncbi:hypothetical protein HC931_02320 [Candidatus Gracilibacteria bacterium]|nr:hypothetical protein [Candidatus Gracilibacteria bacterium]NJP19310.1 hypothetical protein [Hydrococcus sp. CRU_1_1]